MHEQRVGCVPVRLVHGIDGEQRDRVEGHQERRAVARLPERRESRERQRREEDRHHGGGQREEQAHEAFQETRDAVDHAGQPPEDEDPEPERHGEDGKQEPVLAEQVLEEVDADDGEERAPEREYEGHAHGQRPGEPEHEEVAPGPREECGIADRLPRGELLQVHRSLEAGDEHRQHERGDERARGERPDGGRLPADVGAEQGERRAERADEQGSPASGCRPRPRAGRAWAP